MMAPMMSSGPTRRAALTGLSAGLIAAPALAAPPPLNPGVQSHAGFSAWKAPEPRKGDLSLKGELTVDGGARMPLKAWLDGRPAVLIVWASWCGPCMADKPYQARMDRKLKAASSRARILSLQCFDEDADPEAVAWRLKRLGAQDMAGAVASRRLEQDLLKWFGPAESDRTRTSTPSLALIGGDGVALGRCQGRPFTPQDKEWWRETAAFDLLNSLK
jgi:thiol-disulfide isomerase/thioredoxin